MRFQHPRRLENFSRAWLPTTAQVTQRHEIGENGKLRGPQRDSRRHPIVGRELMNCSSSAPAGLFPKADRQWRLGLAEEGKHPSTHWFSGSCHARLPSQWGKQVLGFNVTPTRALMRCHASAVSKLRRQEIAQATRSRVVPAGVPGTPRSSVLAPRTSTHLSRRRDPHLSPYV